MSLQENSLEKIDLLIAEKHLLKHPFYQAWSAGKLSLDCLREYAREYYHHVKAFPTYLSALHSHTEEQNTRIEILKNLLEEESENSNHPHLWKQFAFACGATERDLEMHQPSKEMQILIEEFRNVCSEGSTAEGLASLYAYESQIPAICISKIQGLKQHYGMTQPNQWRYFTVHIDADEEHAAVERKLLVQYLREETAEKTLGAVNRVLDALGNFLSSLCHRYQVVDCIAF